MTFLVTFFKFLFLLLLVGFLGMFGTREVLLYLASQQVVSDVRSITQSSRWDELVVLCEGGVVTEVPFDGFQVRFISATEYKVEAHCLASAPGVQKTAKLPYQVKKTTGSAGFFYDFTNKNLTGEVTLELWGQKRIVYAEGNSPGQNWGKTTIQASVPSSVCVAHGFTCCDAVQELGQGESVSNGVTDCPTQCFTSCLKRPLLLSFNSDPQANYETRQVLVPKLEAAVIFSFLFDDTESPISNVKIDFGDGTSQEVTTRNGQLTKEYVCKQTTCTYKVKLVGVDAREIPSANTRLSELEVIMGAIIPGAL
jgi:hypothetical protein